MSFTLEQFERFKSTWGFVLSRVVILKLFSQIKSHARKSLSKSIARLMSSYPRPKFLHARCITSKMIKFNQMCRASINDENSVFEIHNFVTLSARCSVPLIFFEWKMAHFKSSLIWIWMSKWLSSSLVYN